MDAILDTTVLVHLLRRREDALNWLKTQGVVGITPVTWLEVMEGSRNKANQAYSKQTLDQFPMFYLTTADQQWAMIQLETFQFSHHIGMNDCLIASVSYRLQIPLYTHNLKDMTPMIGALAQTPY